MIIEEKLVWAARIFFVVLLIIALSGCSTTYSDVGRANNECLNNGGLSHILTKYNSTVRVTCNNGAKFTLKKEDTE